MYSPIGRNGDIEHILYHINHGMLYFSGMEVLPPFIAWSVAHSEEKRQQYLKEYEQRLLTLETVEPILYHPAAHYDENGQLRPEFLSIER
jgi:Putative NADPH-quinone reductase (modulator of drug activity B)